MPELSFNKNTDKQETAKVESTLLYAVWISPSAICGQKAVFEVGTSMVGFGAPVEVTVRVDGGKKIGTVKGVMRCDRFRDAIAIPDDLDPEDELYFEVNLSKNSLKGESDRIPVAPPVEIKNLKWSAKEARRGEVLTLSAEVEKGIGPGEEVLITIWEYDAGGVHDKIAELPAIVKDSKTELQWEYEYHEDTDEIPTKEEKEEYGGSYNPPEYFFTVNYHGVVFGRKQESRLLVFKDWFDIVLEDENGQLVPDAKYTLHLADGSTRDGTLDASGRAREEDIPPGAVRVEFPDFEVIDPFEGDE